MIRRAASHDLDAVEQIYMQNFISERRNEARFSGWIAGVWPNRTAVRRAIAKGELYALWDGEEIVAAMIMRRGQPDEYEALRWPVRSFPSQVIGGDMVVHSKPKPDIYLKACEMLGFAPEDCFAVEDSPNGIRSAHAAGLMPVMVPDLVEPTEELRNLSVRVEEDLLSFLNYLKTL